MVSIVTVSVSERVAPTPSTLQRTGAFISQGGTNLTPGTYALLTSPSSLATNITGAVNMTGIAWASEIVTVTVAGGHAYPVGRQFWMTIAGVVPASYNGTFLITVTGSTTFTYFLLTDPGAESTLGNYLPLSATQLTQMNTTFFTQGSTVPVYVLELGVGTAANGVAALQNFITANSSPQFFYSYLVPRYWDGDPAYLELLAAFEGPAAKTYFFTTMTLNTFGLYAPKMKDVIPLIEAPALGVWPSNLVTELLGPPTIPSLSETGSGGTLPTGTYYVRTTYVTAFGETLPSPENTQAITLGQDLVITSPGAKTGATGWYAYVSTTSGTEVRQQALGSATAIATDLTISAPLASNGALSTTGYVVLTTTTAHAVAIGEWFQLSGFTPIGYNGWFQAIGGTTGSTLVYMMSLNPGPETVLGSLDASLAQQAAIPSSEFTLASPFYDSLRYNPNSANLMTPFAFTYEFGVTPWSTQGNSTLLATLKAAFINFILTGAEGGLPSNLVLYYGTTLDGSDFMEWYSADWAQINGPLAITNAVINGSNNPLAPLYYDPNGIATLQDVLVGVSQNAVSFGLANGTVKQSSLSGIALAEAIEAGTFDGAILVNAVPFAVYLKGSPGDYKLGQYNGLSWLYVVNRGFTAIQINVVLSDFPIQ